MKKLLVTLTILVMSILVLASCEGLTPDNNGGANNDPVNECPHNNLIELPETNSTCIKAGLTSGLQCMDCGAITLAQAEKNLLPHNEQDIDARPATCNADGVTASKRCVMCLVYTVPATKIPKLNHVIDGESKVVDSDTVEATCTEPGSTGGKHCSVCYATVEAATVTPPTDHTIKITPAQDPTCQENGCTEKKECETCGEVFVDSTTVEKGDDYHNFEWTVDANDATKENGECTVDGCDATTTRDVVDVEEGGAED